MGSSANIRLYQPDYEKLKKVAEDNQISIAEAVNKILTNYEKMLQGPQTMQYTVNFGGK